MKKILLFIICLLSFCKIAIAQKNYSGYFPGTSKHYPSADSLNLILKNAYEKGVFRGIDPSCFSPKKNVTDTTKKYLLAILNWEISKEELEKRVDEYIADIPYKYAFNHKFWGGGLHDTIVNKVGYYAMDFDSLYHVYFDSLKMTYRDEVRAKIRKNSKKNIPDQFVLSAATAQIKEAIPIIKNDLAAAVKRFDTSASILALAILGDSVNLKKVYAKHNGNLKRNNLTFNEIVYEIRSLTLIYTQQSISLMADWLDTTKIVNGFSEDSNFEKMSNERFIGTHVLPILVRFIKDENFNKGYLKLWENKTDINFYDVSEKEILFVKNWINNKGKKMQYYLP